MKKCSGAFYCAIGPILFFLFLTVLPEIGGAADLSKYYKSPQMADALTYVRQHKGEGTRKLLYGSETELKKKLLDNQNQVEEFKTVFDIYIEDHAVINKGKSAESATAYYFYPTQSNDMTEVEVLCASPWSSAEDLRNLEKSSLSGLVDWNREIINRLQKPDFDPNAKIQTGMGPGFLPLVFAVTAGKKDTANRLINKGANIDLAIKELQESAAKLSVYLDKPYMKTGYDKTMASIEMLKKLKAREGEKQNDADFDAAVKTYRAKAGKVQLSEEARKYKVQAEGAVRDKDFADAADLFAKALKIAPWWPEGHFNRAIVLAETQDYDTAIIEMKRYLTLVPKAQNARAAQDKIYEWERKTGK